MYYSSICYSKNIQICFQSDDMWKNSTHIIYCWKIYYVAEILHILFAIELCLSIQFLSKRYLIWCTADKIYNSATFCELWVLQITVCRSFSKRMSQYMLRRMSVNMLWWNCYKLFESFCVEIFLRPGLGHFII